MKEPDSYHVDLWVAVRRGQWRESPGRALIQTPRSRCSPPPREQSPAARGCCSAAVWSLRSSGAPLSLPSSSLGPPAPPLSSHRRECSPPGTEQIINPTPENINYLVFAVHLLCVVLSHSLHNVDLSQSDKQKLSSDWPFRSVCRWHRISSRQEDRVLVQWPWPGLLSRTNWGEKREEKLNFSLINEM